MRPVSSYPCFEVGFPPIRSFHPGDVIPAHVLAGDPDLASHLAAGRLIPSDRAPNIDPSLHTPQSAPADELAAVKATVEGFGRDAGHR